MTLDERIAKRKAEGWTLSYFLVRRKELRAGMIQWRVSYDVPGVNHSTARCRAFMHDARTVPTVSGSEVLVAVYGRTIRTKRGHSFSWALARMKEGKRVRRPLPLEFVLHISAHGALVAQNFPGGAEMAGPLGGAHILADDWELAE